MARYEYAVVYLNLDTGSLHIDQPATEDYFGAETYFDEDTDRFTDNQFSKHRLATALAKAGETNA